MPDFSAEYWLTAVPAGQAAIVKVRFPDWSPYAALTVRQPRSLTLAEGPCA